MRYHTIQLSTDVVKTEFDNFLNNPANYIENDMVFRRSEYSSTHKMAVFVSLIRFTKIKASADFKFKLDVKLQETILIKLMF